MNDTLFEASEGALIARLGGETVRIEPAGPDALRVRATRNRALDDEAISALLPHEPVPADIATDETTATITCGRLRATMALPGRGIDPCVLISFDELATGETLLREAQPHFLWPGSRAYAAEGGDLWRVETRFAARRDEKFFGLGQHQHGLFDQKGAVVDLVQRNTEVSIPFLYSSANYGLIWNSPGIGRVELAANHTRWVMDAVPQIDYVVIAGDGPGPIMQRYTALTGRPPMMPDWAMGFWQCKLRYKTQDEVLEVAREYRRRALPLDCIVIDFFHWPKMGEWRFKPDEFPDPSAMVAELRQMGIEPMVSVWPAVNANAETHDDMAAAGHLIQSRRGALDGMIFYDREPDGRNPLKYYDATHPGARDFHWQRVHEGYVRHGITSFWLDANEPEAYPAHPDNMRFWAGDGRAVANAYPFCHHLGYGEHFAADGIEDGVLLSRSAWLGSQRFPVIVWSGDVASSFAAFAGQVRAGLNAAMSGLSWWTTDIGGFHDGDVNDPAFHELLVRWFQYGAFCPVFRLHGFRKDASRDPRFGELFSFGGADNEVWSFGEPVYRILRRYLFMRERLKPYVAAQMRTAAQTGVPPMRPLFFDFPADEAAWAVSDAYLFGPDLLVAPVLEAGAKSRSVHLPAGSAWTDAWTGARHQGGGAVTVECPLDRIPLFLRDGADLPIVDET